MRGDANLKETFQKLQVVISPLLSGRKDFDGQNPNLMSKMPNSEICRGNIEFQDLRQDNYCGKNIVALLIHGVINAVTVLS